MSSFSNKHRMTVAVCASEVGKRALIEREGCRWDVVPYSSFEQLVELIRLGSLDVVALPFDVMDETSPEHFLALSKAQLDQRPLLVSYSTFNPGWIDNLVASLGVRVHLRGEFELDALLGALDEYLQCALGGNAKTGALV
ncbi:hypothetical protein [Tateyamaria sp. SN3-11]|uniref:hypothetical protein n=1 Tax=Tateyamaria sp. SN3-11 TaxID=3092147 RepID=UPI0039E9B2CE